MRIISGLHKGYPIKAPKGLPTRPTTDRSKEGLFNILCNWYDFENCDVLDLYCGTGNITYEFASRGAKSVVSIDRHKPCVDFVKSQSAQLQMNQVQVVQSDALDFLRATPLKFDIVFADPPFATKDYEALHGYIVSKNMVHDKGCFVMEHHSVHNFGHLAHFSQARHYGQNVISIYELDGQ
jgi:16S rRNA (guanine(966)-N(2))-methyltransferase RsmD